MMRIIFLVMLPLAWSYGDTQGGGGFAFVDSNGNRVFNTNLESQKLAINAARKAFDLTSNQPGGYAGGYSGGYSGSYPGGYGDYSGGYYPNPNIASRFPAFPSFPAFTMPRPTNFGNSAFASAVAGPGYQHHVASINPSNARVPNVDQTINHYSDQSVPNGGGFYAVSSKSYSSSSNLNGKEVNNRGAETVVNDNGKITQYKVHS